MSDYARFVNRIVIVGRIWTFPFEDTSIDSVVLNPLDILPRQNWVGKLTFLLPILKLRGSFPLTNK